MICPKCRDDHPVAAVLEGVRVFACPKMERDKMIVHGDARFVNVNLSPSRTQEAPTLASLAGVCERCARTLLFSERVVWPQSFCRQCAEVLGIYRLVDAAYRRSRRRASHV